MGGGSWDPSAYASYSSSVRSKSLHETFTATSASFKAKAASGAKDSLCVKDVKIRESRDSADNPESTALIVALDVTGSMGMLARYFAVEGLGILFNEILARKPVTNPHLMFMAFDDVTIGCDPALQASQFEADDRIIKQLSDIYLTQNGGGNQFESYNLPWYFAAMHTSIDCVEKRGKKGYLFTLGDEEPPAALKPEHVEAVMGYRPEQAYTNADLLAMVGRMYHVFHIMVAEGSYARHAPDRVRGKWTDLLGQRALWLEDHTKLAEVVTSAIQVTEGTDVDDVVKSWSGDTSLVVAKTIGGLATTGGAGGVVRL